MNGYLLIWGGHNGWSMLVPLWAVGDVHRCVAGFFLKPFAGEVGTLMEEESQIMTILALVNPQMKKKTQKLSICPRIVWDLPSSPYPDSQKGYQSSKLFFMATLTSSPKICSSSCLIMPSRVESLKQLQSPARLLLYPTSTAETC